MSTVLKKRNPHHQPAAQTQICQLSFPLCCSVCFFNLLTVVEWNTFLRTAHIISEIIHTHTANLCYLTAITLRFKANIIANDPDHPLYLAYLKSTPLQLQMLICTEKSKGKMKEVVTICRTHPQYPIIITNSTGMMSCKLRTVLSSAVCNVAQLLLLYDVCVWWFFVSQCSQINLWMLFPPREEYTKLTDYKEGLSDCGYKLTPWECTRKKVLP